MAKFSLNEKQKRTLSNVVWCACLIPAIVVMTRIVSYSHPVEQAYVAGHWMGTRSSFEVFDIIPWLLVGFFGFALSLIFFPIRSLFFALACVGTCAIVTLPRSGKRNFDPAARIQAELPSYRRAVQSKTKFGDQFTEVHEGRTLHYWRWIKWGIDDAHGVIYDSADKLSKEEWFFREPANGGMIFKLKKIEPHWYFVQHS